MAVKQDAELATQSGSNFCLAQTGPFDQLDTYKLEVPALKRTVSGKLFIREFLGLTGMQISLNKLPAGAAVPFYHSHKENEEAYIFISGKGQIQIDGKTMDVREGSVVRVSTGGSRTLRNNSDSDLCYICIQARENSLKSETFEDGVRSEERVIWPE